MIQSLLKNSGIYFAGLTLGKILNVFLFIILARFLGPGEFGNYIFFITFLQLVTVIADLGLIQWYQKESHNRANEELMHVIIPVRTTTLIVSMSVVSAVIFFTHLFSLEVAGLLLLIMIPEAFLSVLDGYYFHRQKSFIVALKTTIETALMIICILIFRSGIHFHTIAYIYLATSLSSLVWYVPWKALRNIKFPGLRHQLRVIRSSIKYAYLIFTSFAYARGDSLVIKAYLNSSALGLYSAAYRYLESLSLLPTALAHNLFPISAKEGNVTSRHLKSITLIMSVIGLFVGAILWFGADIFIIAFVGPKYAGAIPVLKVLSFVLVFFFVNAPLSAVVQSSSQVTRFLPWGVANTAANIALNILLVPLFGITGAAFVMLVTEITGFVINIVFIRKIYA